MQVSKTTMNLPTPLLTAAKRYALEQNTSVTQLVITGLQNLIAGNISTHPSMVDFIASLPKKPHSTDKQRSEIYRKRLTKKYG